MLRRPLHSDPAGALRRTANPSRTAAGKEILVAAAAPWRQGRGNFPRLQPVRAHLLALGGNEPAGAGRIVAAPPGTNDFRAAGGTSRRAIRGARALRFPGSALARRGLWRFRPAP